MAVSFFAALPALSQTTQTAPSSTPTSTQDQQPHGQIIFSRSVDDNGQITSAAGPAAKVGGQPVTSPVATDSERESLTFTAFDMDVHLRPAAQRTTAILRLLTSRCKFLLLLTGKPFASAATTLPSLLRPSTPTSTTPASFMKPPSPSSLRSLLARASSSMSPTPAPSRNPPSGSSPSALPATRRSIPTGTPSRSISRACAVSAMSSGTPYPAFPSSSATAHESLTKWASTSSVWAPRASVSR